VRLPPRFHLVIDGTLHRVNRRTVVVPDHLPYLLGRLLSGEEVADEAFAPFGLTVVADVDMDQADDVPDGLDDYARSITAKPMRSSPGSTPVPIDNPALPKQGLQ